MSEMTATATSTTEESGAAYSEVRPFDLDDDALVKKIRGWFKEDAAAKGKHADKRKLAHRMYAGDQWEQADRTAANTVGSKKPLLTLNYLLSIISAVEGEERTNRQEMKFYGEGQEDDGAAAGLNRILKWIMHQCGGEFVLSAQFREKLIAGEGWIVPEVDYFEDPEGKIKLVFVDDSEAYDDCLNTHPTSENSRRFTRVKQFTKEEIDARWAGACAKLQESTELDGAAPVETDGKGYRDIYSTPGDTKSVKLYDAQKCLYTVMETWWWQIEDGWVVVDEATGMLVEKSPDEFEAMRSQREAEQKEALSQLISGNRQRVPIDPADPAAGMTFEPLPKALQATERKVKRFYQAFSCVDVLLAKQASPVKDLKRIPYVPTRALYDKENNRWFGLVEPLVDLQKQTNVEQSVFIQLMQLMPKQSWMAPKGGFHNKNEWSTKLAQPGAMLEYNPTRGKPEPVPVQAIPRHLTDMGASRPATMRDISGVNVDMMGQRVAGDPGVVMEMRQKAAKTVLAPIFDNFRQSKIALGMVLLAYIQTYVSIGRRIRVLGPQGDVQYVQMTEQMQLGRYDLTVEETDATVNDRIATLNILQTTLPMMLKSGMPLTPEFVDLMPMPPHVRDAWKRQISWEMTLGGKVPPPGWQPGMPAPAAGPPGLPAPVPPQGGEPNPAPVN